MADAITKAGTGLNVIDDSSLTVTTPAGLGTVDVVVTNSQGSDTIVDGFDYNSGGSFVNLGPSGIPGTFGEPAFSGSGDLTPGSAAGFTLTCTDAQPFALGFAFIGFSSTPQPFFGGTFYPTFPVNQKIFPFNGAGVFTATTSLDGSFPGGTEIVIQWFFEDFAAVQGVSGSNGLQLNVP